MREMKLLQDMGEWKSVIATGKMICANLIVRPKLMTRVKEVQEQDSTLRRRREKAQKGELHGYTIGSDGILRYQDRIFLPRNSELKEEVLREAHCSKYNVHPGSTKMYRDLRLKYCWDDMKREVAQYVTKF
ncbi:hypothetical protein BPMI_01159 [Candidatus Burkholderia pumila]|uniref:Integrase zinc-binding domain-containing protein n=1 Tax=Candidatus Burkholderia pumila TaxID=1090375 RepID=A0ABR5HJM5_9BURK|nr:hypothetical protein BPMI_01159 [Candidatus Burkholderia pumila]